MKIRSQNCWYNLLGLADVRVFHGIEIFPVIDRPMRKQQTIAGRPPILFDRGGSKTALAFHKLNKKSLFG